MNKTTMTLTIMTITTMTITTMTLTIMTITIMTKHKQHIKQTYVWFMVDSCFVSACDFKALNSGLGPELAQSETRQKSRQKPNINLLMFWFMFLFMS